MLKGKGVVGSKIINQCEGRIKDLEQSQNWKGKIRQHQCRYVSKNLYFWPNLSLINGLSRKVSWFLERGIENFGRLISDWSYVCVPRCFFFFLGGRVKSQQMSRQTASEFIIFAKISVSTRGWWNVSRLDDEVLNVTSQIFLSFSCLIPVCLDVENYLIVLKIVEKMWKTLC